VLADPSSLSAREELAREWRATGDERAGFIELQLQRRTLFGASGEANTLLRKIYDLTQQRGKAWAADVAPMVTKYKFHRGCVAEVTLPGARFAEVMPRLVTLAPIQHVNLTAPLDLQAVLASPAFERMTSLMIESLGPDFGDAEARILAESPRTRGLRWIRLANNAIEDEGVRALAASPHLASCGYLDLDGNPANPGPTHFDVVGYGAPDIIRTPLGDWLVQTYGERAWLALPTMTPGVSWPPDRDEACLRTSR
jgi:hypothetical protein